MASITDKMKQVASNISQNVQRGADKAVAKATEFADSAANDPYIQKYGTERAAVLRSNGYIPQIGSSMNTSYYMPYVEKLGMDRVDILRRNGYLLSPEDADELKTWSDRFDGYGGKLKELTSFLKSEDWQTAEDSDKYQAIVSNYLKDLDTGMSAMKGDSLARGHAERYARYFRDLSAALGEKKAFYAQFKDEATYKAWQAVNQHGDAAKKSLVAYDENGRVNAQQTLLNLANDATSYAAAAQGRVSGDVPQEIAEKRARNAQYAALDEDPTLEESPFLSRLFGHRIYKRAKGTPLATPEEMKGKLQELAHLPHDAVEMLRDGYDNMSPEERELLDEWTSSMPEDAEAARILSLTYGIPTYALEGGVTQKNYDAFTRKYGDMDFGERARANIGNTLANYGLGMANTALTGLDALSGGRLGSGDGTVSSIYQAANFLQNAGSGLTETAYNSMRESSNWLGKLTLDLERTGIEQLTDRALGLATGGAGGLIPMAVRVFGQGAQESENRGESLTKQVFTGGARGAVEVATEMMSGVGGSWRGTGYGDSFLNVVDKWLASKTGRELIGTLGRAFTGEAIEEMMADILNPLMDRILGIGEVTGRGEDRTFMQRLGDFLKDVWGDGQLLYDGLLGGLAGMGGGGVEHIGYTAQARNLAVDVATYKAAQRIASSNSMKSRFEELTGVELADDESTAIMQAAMYLTNVSESTEGRPNAREVETNLFRGTTTGNEKRSGELAVKGLKGKDLEGAIKQIFQDGNVELNESEIHLLADGYTPSDMDPMSYIMGTIEAYKLGKVKGLTLQQAINLSGEDGARLHPEQFRHAFDLGRGVLSEESNAVDVNTEEGRKALSSALASLGTHTETAANAYEAGQDLNTYAAAMNKAATLYAANGADLKAIVKDARAGKRSDIVGMLTDAQVATAIQIGQQLQQQTQQAVQQMDEQYTKIREQAAAITAQGAASAQEIEKIDAAIKGANKTGKQAMDAFKATLASLEAMVEADPAAENSEAYNRAYDEAKAYYETAQEMQRQIQELEQKKKELEGKKPVLRKKGTVSFDGGNIDGTQFKGIDRENLTRQQKNVVAMVQRLADLINIDYVFFDGPPLMGGAYVRGGTVYININSGMGGELNKSIAAASLSHELTHFMQEYAPKEYAELKDYVVSAVLNKSPAEFDRLVKQQMRWEPGKTYDHLVDELVANACQTMLLNDEAVTRMARENMTLAEKVADVLEDITGKIRSAFEGINFAKDKGPFDAVRAVMDEMDGIAKLWGDGIAAAAENYNAVQTVQQGMESAATEDGVKYQKFDENDSIIIQLSKAQDRLNAMPVAARIDISDIPKGVQNIRKWAYNRLKSYGFQVQRKNFGTIIFDDKRINQALGHILHKPNEMGAVAALPQVLKRGEIIEQHEHHKGRVQASFTIAAPVEINGVRGNMAVVVQRTTKNYYHAHRILLPDNSSFTFEESVKKADSKPSGELPENQALIAKTIETASESRIAETADVVKGKEEGSTKHQQWDDEAPVQQEISSAATSINANKLPVLYTNKNAVFTPGSVNVDVGGGRFDNVTEYLKKQGVRNLIFDPYNRDEQHNRSVLMYLTDGNQADTATCSNCLNVIKEVAARRNVILECAKAIKPDGKAYFTVYEGDGSGEGKVTKSGWQENRKTASYVPEIEQFFENVVQHGKIIVAEKPKANLPRAAWETSPGKATRFQRWDDTTDDTAAERNGRELAYARLQSENAILSETVDALRKLTDKQNNTIEKLQQRLQITKTPEVRQGDARKLARSLLNEHNSRADQDQIAAQLKALGDYILQTPTAEISEETLKNQARSIAMDILENSYEDVNIEGKFNQQIVADIRGRKLSIDESFLGELDQEGGYEAFRKRYFGSFTLARRESNSLEAREDYITVDQLYIDMQGEYGKSYFPDVANEGEQVQIIARMFDAAKPIEVNPFDQYMGEASEELANRIVMDAMSGVLRQTEPTTADKQKARKQALRDQILQLKEEKKLGDREAARLYQTIYDLSMALDRAESKYETLRQAAMHREKRVRAEGSARALEIRARERARAEEQIQALKAHYRQIERNARQRRENTGVRRKIRNLIDDLNRRLAKPTEKRHVPMELLRLTVDVLDMIDFDSGRGGENFAQKIQKIRTMYDSYRQDPKYAAVYDDVAAEMLRDLSVKIGETNLYEMNDSQLKATYDTLKSLTHIIDEAVMVRIGNEERNAFEVAQEMTKETREIPKAQKGWLKQHYIPAHLRPDVAFRRFAGFKKNSAWESVCRMLNDGQLKQTEITMKLSLQFAELTNNEKAMRDYMGLNVLGFVDKSKLIDIGLKDENGRAIPVTHGIAVGIYMELQNEDSRRTLIRGGKTIPNLKDYYSGKGGFGIGATRAVGIATELSSLHHERREATANGDTAHADEVQKRIEELKLSGERYADAVQKNIERQLTDFDRKWIKRLAQFYNVDCKQYLNETTEEVYGITKANTPNYYPIIRDPNFLASSFEAVTRDMNLENVGFMKERVEASNPSLALDASYLANLQIQRVAQYCGLMPAIRNFNKIWNKMGYGYSDSLKNAVNATFGKEGGQYVENLIADLTGSRSVGDDSLGINRLMAWLRGNLAQTTLTLNPRVALAQAASFPTAAPEVGAKALTKAFFRGGRSGRMISRADTELIAKYSPLLYHRMQGYSSVELGDIKNSQRLSSRVWKKMRWVTGWIQAIDGATVGRLWYAAEYWVQENMPSLTKGTDAYYQQVAIKFNDVVEKTQPNYTTMQRPQILRDPNELVRSMTMFMTQRLQNLNILYDAAGTYQKARADKANGRNGVTQADVSEAKAQLVTAVSSQLTQAAVYVGFRLFAYMLLHNMKAYRDDDDGELTLESVSMRLLDNYIDSFASMFIGGSMLHSILSAATGHSSWYGISLSGVDSMNDLIDNLMKLASTQYDLTNEKSKAKFKKQLTKVALSLCQCLGIPANNAIKIGDALLYHIEDIQNGEFGSFEAGFEPTSKQQKAREIEAVGFTREEYEQIMREADKDGNGRLKQDELYSCIQSHKLTDKQIEYLWNSQKWSTSYADYDAKQRGSTKEKSPTLPKNKPEEPGVISTYEQYKSAVPLYKLDQKIAAYDVWENILQPSGMSLDRFTKILTRADTDSNGSLKQDELGDVLRGAVRGGEMTEEQAAAVWDSQGWAHDYAWWVAKH